MLPVFVSEIEMNLKVEKTRPETLYISTVSKGGN